MENGPNGRRDSRRIANCPTHPPVRRMLNVNSQRLPLISPEKTHKCRKFFLILFLLQRLFGGVT